MPMLIVMNNDKSLSKKETVVIYQKESLVDKIKFLVPLKYQEIDLTNYTVTLRYLNQANEPCSEVLEPSGEYYKNVMEYYHLPVNTNITRFAGNIELWLAFKYMDADTQKEHILYSGTTTITINPSNNHCFDNFSPDSTESESVEKIIERLTTMEQEILRLDKNKADNIKEFGSEIQLESNGELIGDSISIDTNSQGGSIGKDGIPIIEFSDTQDDNINEDGDIVDDEDEVVEF